MINDIIEIIKKVYHGIENIDFEQFKKLYLFNRLKLSYFY